MVQRYTKKCTVQGVIRQTEKKREGGFSGAFSEMEGQKRRVEYVYDTVPVKISVGILERGSNSRPKGVGQCSRVQDIHVSVTIYIAAYPNSHDETVQVICRIGLAGNQRDLSRNLIGSRGHVASVPVDCEKRAGSGIDPPCICLSHQWSVVPEGFLKERFRYFALVRHLGSDRHSLSSIDSNWDLNG